ncbi:SDR family oxidoreductase [Acetobacteraceae bacterium]|nr:SDR family oxidoreductase [Acetobacteraceae bacterium]
MTETHDKHDFPTRRNLLAGAAFGAATLAVEGLPRQGFAAGKKTGLEDPLKMYPAPPFSQKLQPWPGLQSKMTPRPDCGEKSYVGSGRLKGRHALITGGDSGIGRAVAIAFAREGADVAINYLPEEESDAQEVIAYIRKAGRKAVALPGDLREEAFCQKLAKEAHDRLGGLDCLVNNAGYQTFQEDLLDLTTEHLDQTFKTNVYALIWLTKASVALMKPGSCVVNTTSVQAYMPSPGLVDYAATKSAISSITRSLGKQLLSRGIRVNAVAPGPFWTPLETTGAQPLEVVNRFGSGVPYKRPGQPVEIAPAYVTLASAESSYATSQIWEVTGGMT